MKEYEKDLTIANAHKCLALQSEISLDLQRLFVYARLRKDENSADPKYQAMSETAEMLSVEASSAASFIAPKLAKIPTSDLKAALNKPEYEKYAVILEDVIRDKKHILSEKEEKLLSEVSAFAGDFETIFHMFDDADIRFGEITKDGKPIKLSHGMYSVLLQDASQEIRKSAFEEYYKGYTDMLNTIAAIYAGSVKKDSALSKVKKFKSALSAALYSEVISEKVYNNLLSAVEKATPAVHKYCALRKKALGLKELHVYDMYVPLVPAVNLAMEYEDAFNLVVKALAPLGEKYLDVFKKAYGSRWIDVEETENKRSGAYEWIAYGCHPVVLLNYQKTVHDIFTIAHEMGHALHSYFSFKNQCFEKAEYSIFIAETASTCNEVLLLKYLLKTAAGDLRKNLLSYYLDMFRTTLFRQTLFAEFEKYAHGEIEAARPLTAEGMSEKYLELNKKYYGEDVVYDKEISREWMRIPHFYRAFYVYKYATGLTVAVNLADKLLNEEGFVDKYIKYLSAGGSLKPLETLKIVDIDLEKKEPFRFAMKEFGETLKELKKLY